MAINLKKHTTSGQGFSNINHSLSKYGYTYVDAHKSTQP